MAGDFNDLLLHDEKVGRAYQPNCLINGFCRTVEFCGLFNVGFMGNKFTWEREAANSDHSALFMSLRVIIIRYAHKSFRFENSWLCEENIQDVVHSAWKEGDFGTFHDRVVHCGEVLKQCGLERKKLFKEKLRQSKQQMSRYRTLRDSQSIELYYTDHTTYLEVLRQ
ncbi:hypothetical protein GH714_032198 [Hevea brasiliensis]|uniref:Endonuclease/exonuclease/phosphatase domain-containing protein n=1 Tax=Hevea brasiliensis TaxID=3981 RepID=A0A6A6L1N8_HEVBR|nr:hypothetical protein GH714_032198 [Hevea brasiliensis]